MRDLQKYTYFGGWNDAVCFHDPIWILFSDFGKQECSQTAASSSSQGMSQLETYGEKQAKVISEH